MHPAVRRFVRYAGIGMSTLTFDLLLIALLTQLFGVPYYLSTPLGFVVAVSINYFLSRRFVFVGTERPMHHGYGYFIAIAFIGAVAITGAVYLLVTYLALNYLVARSGRWVCWYRKLPQQPAFEFQSGWPSSVIW